MYAQQLSMVQHLYCTHIYYFARRQEAPRLYFSQAHQGQLPPYLYSISSCRGGPYGIHDARAALNCKGHEITLLEPACGSKL